MGLPRMLQKYRRPRIQSVTELAREYIVHRANGTVSDEEEATFTALPQIRERLLIQKEIILIS